MRVVAQRYTDAGHRHDASRDHAGPLEVHASLDAAEQHFRSTTRAGDEMYVWPLQPDQPLTADTYDVGVAPVLFFYETPATVTRSGSL